MRYRSYLKVLFQFVIFAYLFMCNTYGYSQNSGGAKTSALKAKYSLVEYHPECGGWYFLSYQKDGQMLYGFADCSGNVVASDATKYKLHKGFIELYLIDKQKKALHDQWKNDMVKWQRDYDEYNRNEAKYEAELDAYKAKRAQAHEEAKKIYNREVEAAQQRANYQNQQYAQQYQNSGKTGAILGALSGVLNSINASVSVDFDPIFNKVLADRDLLVKPAKPYNPYPTKPTEPSSGYYWEKFPLRQNARYSYVDYDKIENGSGFANVKNGNKYGLVNAEFKVIVPCTATSEVLKQQYYNGHYLIDVNGKFSVIDENATKIIKDADGIEILNGNYNVKHSGKWNIHSFSGKKINTNGYEQIKAAEGHYLCKTNNLWGVFTSNFKQLYSCKYQDLKLHSIEGKKILFTKLNGQWGAVDFSTGKDIIPNNYKDIKFETSNSYLTVVKGNDKCGIYQTNGRMIIPAEFDNVSIKSNGIEAKLGNTIGLYNTYGFKIIPAGKYTAYKECPLGKLKAYEVKDGNLTGIISQYGYEIIPCRYSSLKFSPEANIFFATIDDKAGVLACDGSIVIPFTVGLSDFSAINNLTYRNKPYILTKRYVKNKYRYGAVNFEGKTIVPPLKGKPLAAEKAAEKAAAKGMCNKVAVNNAYSIIDNANKTFNERYSSEAKKASTFTYFAQNYVESIINDWQRKGEFEKTSDYQKRVNVNSRQAKVLQLTTEAKDAYIAMRSKEIGNDKLSIIGNYDPDNETYQVKSQYSSEPIVIHVPSEHAQAFKSSFSRCSSKPQFFVENDNISLSEYSFSIDGNTFYYNSKNELAHQVPDVEYSFDAIQIDKSEANLVSGSKKQKFSTTQFITKSSDVDINIPVTTIEQKHTFAVIIANESYENEQNVPFAYHDGNIFKEYCIKTLGIPKQNIRFGTDLTANQIRNHINWIEETAEAFEGKARFILYYVGHGMPNEKTKDAYIIPSDGNARNPETGYKLSDLYSTLGKIPAENTLVLLDACFSGAQRSGQMAQKGARGVVLTANKARPTGNVLVMSASSAQETAWPYAEKSHGLFTYFLLKKLQESKGVPVKMGDMFKYVKANVKQHAITKNNKSQTPDINPSPAILSTWESIKL